MEGGGRKEEEEGEMEGGREGTRKRRERWKGGRKEGEVGGKDGGCKGKGRKEEDKAEEHREGTGGVRDRQRRGEKERVPERACTTATTSKNIPISRKINARVRSMQVPVLEGCSRQRTP